MTGPELSARFVLSGILATLIYFVPQAFGHWVAWWAAALIALVVVFGGLLILDSDGDWFS